jgi:toxoflavin synthase
MDLELDCDFDVVTAIHLLHYLENAAEIESALTRISALLGEGGHFITMIANPEFDLEKHDASDSKMKFGIPFHWRNLGMAA